MRKRAAFQLRGIVPDFVKDVSALLGKRVVVVLDRADAVIITGQLLGFGDGGTFEILEDDGFVHYCWPMLEIREAVNA